MLSVTFFQNCPFAPEGPLESMDSCNSKESCTVANSFWGDDLSHTPLVLSAVVLSKENTKYAMYQARSRLVHWKKQ